MRFSKNRDREKRERKSERNDEACRMRAGRIKGGFARHAPALDPAGHGRSSAEGVMKD